MLANPARGEQADLASTLTLLIFTLVESPSKSQRPDAYRECDAAAHTSRDSHYRGVSTDGPPTTVDDLSAEISAEISTSCAEFLVRGWRSHCNVTSLDRGRRRTATEQEDSMLNRFLMSGMAVIVATGAIVAAQAPATPGQQPAPGSQPATAQQPATITLVGCLVREQDAPGRKPNIAERAGVLEDYILTSAAMADQPSGSAQTRGTTGTSGLPVSPHISAMYKVEGIPDERLKALVGKKVEVTGRVDEDDARETRGTAGSATPTTPNDDMPEFEATGIREVPGSCTAAPAR